MIILSVQYIHESFSKCLKFNKGNVHSCYHRVLNVVVEDNLYSILSSDIACAPKAIQLVESVDFITLKISSGNTVSFFNSYISIDDRIIIDLSKGKQWKCSSIDTSNICQSDLVDGLRRANKFFFEHIDLSGASIWYRKKLGYNLSITKDSIEHALAIRIEEFVNGWVNGELAPVERLVGLGYGLTPSGDDFLCGFYFAISNLLLDNSCVIDLRKRALDLSCKMSDISRQMVDTYFNGEGNEVFYRFLNAVIHNNFDDMADIYNEILNFGSTSGIDISVGILTGISVFSHQIKGSYNM